MLPCLVIYVPAMAIYLLKTDKFNYQAETDETDNIYSIPIVISQPNLIIAEVTAPNPLLLVRLLPYLGREKMTVL